MAQSHLSLSTGFLGGGGGGGWVRKGVCELSMEVALTQQHREDREGSREQARWLEFLTWREETEGPGDWRSHCRPGGRLAFPPGNCEL